MSLEAISSITGVEDNIRQMKADAAAKAKRDIAAAEKNGQDAVAAAVQDSQHLFGSFQPAGQWLASFGGFIRR